MPVAAMTVALPTASQRLRDRKPRSRSNAPRLAYSGTKRCAEVAKPEIGQVADHRHQRPDIDVDAELEAAHPAREQDLRQVDQAGAEHADQERRAGDPLRDRAVAGVAEPGADLAPVEAREREPTPDGRNSATRSTPPAHSRAAALWARRSKPQA